MSASKAVQIPGFGLLVRWLGNVCEKLDGSLPPWLTHRGQCSSVLSRPLALLGPSLQLATSRFSAQTWTGRRAQSTSRHDTGAAVQMSTSCILRSARCHNCPAPPLAPPTATVPGRICRARLYLLPKHQAP